MTLFEALYGIPPPQLSLGPYQITNIAAVENIVQRRQEIEHQLRKNLAQARARMKLYADRKRVERSFEEGEWKKLGDQSVTVDQPPLVEEKLSSGVIPTKLLQTRMISGRDVEEEQWLIQWSDGGVDDATWEDAEAIRRAYSD
ncbi:Uncharacterized protein Adt_27001 [Abeliophyllum distichum]|uniref:Chromo domain-containing protein n=1 Tax=Abeliophyllum distichum TaxID=126358 RepID=A0ABD1RSH8_9LAMI